MLACHESKIIISRKEHDNVFILVPHPKVLFCILTVGLLAEYNFLWLQLYVNWHLILTLLENHLV